MLARVKCGLIGLLITAAVAGCSSGDGGSDPDPAKGTPRAVAEAIDGLERATARRDFRTICDELFTEAARERAGGDDCAQLLRSTGGGIREPSIRILSIRINGEKADVRVSSSVEGQGAVEETIQLVRDGEEYRVEALGE